MNRDGKLAICLLGLSLLGHLFLLSSRRTASVVSGDEGTFLAMVESAALDLDLVFDETDLDRLEKAPQRGRKTVILQEFGERIAYSKPVLYPVLAAPWYRIGGIPGLILLNTLALAGALVLAWGALARFGCPHPAVMLATLVGTSVGLAYAAWTMSDSLQASMTLAGLALGLAGAREAQDAGAEECWAAWIRVFDRPWAPYLGVLLLALVAAMRLPNLVLAGAPALAWLLRGRRRRAVAMIALVAVATASGFGLNAALSGALMPYKTVRATFNPQSGYPVGEQEAAAREQFSDKVALATQVIGLKPKFDAEVTAYSAGYFVLGRHSGILWYYPLAIFLIGAGLRRPDAVAWALGLAVLALVVFYLVWMPRNYFGGATFLGNRYFLTGYVALLFMPRRSFPRAGFGVGWLIALVVFSSACVSVLRTRELDRSSQTHAHAGLFRALPYEATARDIDGRRDVYWTEEFFRFVDPYAVVDATGFTLRAGDPWAEVLHVNQREAAVVRFLVRSDAPGGHVRYRGPSGEEQAFDLEPNENGSWGLVEIELGETSRRHRYWFGKRVGRLGDASELESPDSGTPTTERLYTRTHRFAFEAAAEPAAAESRDDMPKSAELHYLGSMRLVPKFFRGVAMAVELPEAATAGGRTRIPIRVRNTGMRFWSSTEMVPTRLGYRIFRLPRKEAEAPVRGRLQEFDGRVARATELEVDLDVRWPRKPGRYELEIDLNLGGAIWYGAWNQGPLARAEVEVVPEGASDPDSNG